MLTRNYINYSVRNSQSLVKFLGIANHLMENLPGNAIMRGADNKLFNLTSNEKVILWQSNRFPLFVTCIKRTKNKQFSRQCRYVLIQTIVSIWRENMFGYLSADIICSEKRTVFRQRSSRKTDLWGTDNVQEQISAHIFKLSQIEAIVSIIFQIFFKTRAVLKIRKYPPIFPSYRLDFRRFLSRVWSTLSAVREEERGLLFRTVAGNRAYPSSLPHLQLGDIQSRGAF